MARSSSLRGSAVKRAKFAIAAPRIAVCGLNPHAGEGGHLGREEIDVIAPAIQAMRDAGHDVTGPLPTFSPSKLPYACDSVYVAPTSIVDEKR